MNSPHPAHFTHFSRPWILINPSGQRMRASLRAASGEAGGDTHAEFIVLTEDTPPTLRARAAAALAVLTGKRPI